MKLIDNWKQAWRLWSVRLNAIGLTVMSVVFWSPDTALWLLNAMPGHVRGLIPLKVMIGLSVVIYGAAILARVVRQPKLEKPDAKD